MKLKDEFNGDDAHLVGCIKALIEFDADNALVPHGLGGHARGLLSAAAVRLGRRNRLTQKQIARIIDPNCEWDEGAPNDHRRRKMGRALGKAGAILALFGENGQ